MTAPAPTLYGDAVELGGLTFNGAIVQNAKFGIDRITGWRESPELTYVSTNWPNRDGAYWAEGGSYFRARGLVVEGYVVADNRTDYEAAWDLLQRTVITKSEMTLRRYELPAKELSVRLAGRVEPLEETEVGCRFTIPLLATDPFKRSIVTNPVQVGIVSPRVWNRRYPLRYPRRYTAGMYQTTEVLDTNWVPDPSFELNPTSWALVPGVPAGSAFATGTTGPTDRTRSGGLTYPANGTASVQSVVFPLNGMRSGDTYSLSFDVIGTATLASQAQGQVAFFNASNTEIARTTVDWTPAPSTSATSIRMQATGALPEVATGARVVLSARQLFVGNEAGASATLYFDRVMFNRDPAGTYFDGVTGNCQWTGAVDNSLSQRLGSLNVNIAAEVGRFENLGNWEEWPVSVVNGPLSYGWRIRNATSDEELGFAYELKSGQTMTIDHRAQTAEVNNGDRAEYVYFGTWWSLKPGENVLELTSPSYNGQAKWNLEPRSRWA